MFTVGCGRIGNVKLDGSMIHMPERLRLVEKGYNKAIDDFVEKVKLKYLGVHPDELYEKYYPREICEQVKELAENLKVGETNEQA